MLQGLLRKVVETVWNEKVPDPNLVTETRLQAVIKEVQDRMTHYEKSTDELNRKLQEHVSATEMKQLEVAAKLHKATTDLNEMGKVMGRHGEMLTKVSGSSQSATAAMSSAKEVGELVTEIQRLSRELNELRTDLTTVKDLGASEYCTLAGQMVSQDDLNVLKVRLQGVETEVVDVVEMVNQLAKNDKRSDDEYEDASEQMEAPGLEGHVQQREATQPSPQCGVTGGEGVQRPAASTSMAARSSSQPASPSLERQVQQREATQSSSQCGVTGGEDVQRPAASMPTAARSSQQPETTGDARRKGGSEGGDQTSKSAPCEFFDLSKHDEPTEQQREGRKAAAPPRLSPSRVTKSPSLESCGSPNAMADPDGLPRFGGVASAAGTPMTPNTGAEEKEAAYNWKVLKELPKLVVTGTEAWERNVALVSWMRHTVMSTQIVSWKFAKFVKDNMSKAQERYEYRRANPNQKLGKEPPVDLADKESNSHLCVLLMNTLPLKLRDTIWEEHDDEQDITCLTILDAVWEYVAPGGQDEQKGLTKYVRNPGVADTAEDAVRMLRHWKAARKRSVKIGISALSGLEFFDGLVAMVSKIEKAHPEFKYRVDQLRYSREGSNPTVTYAEQLESLMMDELKTVAANEATAQNRKAVWTAENEAFGHAVTREVKGEVEPILKQVRTQGETEPTPKGGEGDGKRRPKQVCNFFQKTGKCKYGTDCKFLHESSNTGKEKGPKKGDLLPKSTDGESSGKKPEEGSKKTRPCPFLAKEGGCWHGDKCKFLHPKKEVSTASGVRVMNAQRVRPDIPYYRRVLVDTGANEIIRPHNAEWWNEIIVRKEKGRPVKLRLAGGVTVQGAMTQFGEVMTGETTQSDIGWILPVNRVAYELGMKLHWTSDGVTLEDKDHHHYKLRQDQGLAFMEWEDFKEIRKHLARSHVTGRKRFEPSSHCGVTGGEARGSETPVVREVVEVKMIHTNEDSDPTHATEEWKSWVAEKIQEEDEVLIQSMTLDSTEVEIPDVLESLRDKCKIDMHTRTCEKCRKALGQMRVHAHAKSESRNVLSADLSGPHPEAIGTKFKYLFVAVFNAGKPGENLPFVRGLKDKTARSVAAAIESVLAEMKSLAGQRVVVRFHSDAGSEFWNKEVRELLTSELIFQTKTAGYDPRANGRAERFVGIIKRHATSYLIHARVSLRFWFWAACQAAYVYRCRVLNTNLPEDAPTFGHTVLVQKPPPSVANFEEKMTEGLFLCWDPQVIQGAYVAVDKGAGGMTIISTSAPMPWPAGNKKETWTIEANPGGEGKVFVSNKGRLLWRTPSKEEAVTFEERTLPEGAVDGLQEQMNKVNTPQDEEWKKFYHGIALPDPTECIQCDGNESKEEDAVEEVENHKKGEGALPETGALSQCGVTGERVPVRATVATASVPQPQSTEKEMMPEASSSAKVAQKEMMPEASSSAKVAQKEMMPEASSSAETAQQIRANAAPVHDRYWVNDYKGAAQELSDEELSMEVADDDPTQEEISSSVVERMEGPEKEKWVYAMQAELDSLAEHDVYEKLTREETRERYWNKGITPKILPGRMVLTKKPLFDGNGGWKAKARVVCCGNFEKDTLGKDPKNRAEVPGGSEMRTVIALGATNGWSVGSLDVKTAFLHAPMNDEEDGIVLVHPPAILTRLGLVDTGEVWKLKKALYGLRSAPKKWSQTRDEEIRSSTIELDEKVAVCEMCNSAKNIWKVLVVDDKSGSREIMGYFLVYVDDILIMGATRWVIEVIKMIQKSWTCKVMGILVRDGYQTDLKAKSLNFLGCTLEEEGEVLILHQRLYLDDKLKERRMISEEHGKETLPDPREGLQAPVEKGTAEYKEELKCAQQEVGSINWVALKTRPDVACIAAIGASLQTRDPKETIRLMQGCWKYLSKTRGFHMRYDPADNRRTLSHEVEISADASFAPGGDRSRTGLVIKVNGMIVHWASKKQPLTSLSSCEAELEAAVMGSKFGCGVRDMVEELTETKIKMSLLQDNQACIRTLTSEVSSWRTRHYAFRASWIRDLIGQREIDVVYQPGTSHIADGLTKVLCRAKLEEARERLHLQRPEKN